MKQTYHDNASRLAINNVVVDVAEDHSDESPDNPKGERAKALTRRW